MEGETQRLLDEPFQPTDPLKNMYIVKNLGKYFDNYFEQGKSKTNQYPFIISPSHHKLISLGYLNDFWYRFSTTTPEANRISIIGFSLPAHDEYIRQPLYWYIRNFHEHGKPLNRKKLKLKIIDYKINQKETDEFKTNYRFVDQSMTDFYFGGFCEEALEIIFSKE
jgi:hypothetical protein